MFLGRSALSRVMSNGMRSLVLSHARPNTLRDRISVNDLQVRMQAGVDAWGRSVPQPLHIDAHIFTDVARAGQSDHIQHTHNYGTLYRALERFATENACSSMIHAAEGCMQVCLEECHAPYAEVHVRLPRALLHADAAGISLVRSARDPASTHGMMQLEHGILRIHGLRVDAILGVNPWEREHTQRVIVDIDVWPMTCASHNSVAHSVFMHIQASACLTIESLATQVAELLCRQHSADHVRVCIAKPSAIMFAESSSVEIVRDSSSFDLPLGDPAASQPHLDLGRKQTPVHTPQSHHTAVLALGANLGDRARYIEAAVSSLDAHPSIRVVDTSFLYETAPMYYIDQPRFLNGACKISTSLSPHALLDVCQQIERDLGRTKEHVPRNGPRVVDIDIVLYDDEQVTDGERLIIPHARLHERAFVLRPVCDMVPTYVHPVLQRTMASLLPLTMDGSMTRVMPVKDRMWHWGQQTRVMGILNATPDSFSDGGQHLDLERALDTARDMVRAGVAILDVGGQSTAPGRVEVSVEEEKARILPLIKAIREDPITQETPISIDTYRADVAKCALDAGATIVNDVSGGSRDPQMLVLVAHRHCPFIVMHMRGDASTMTRLTHYKGGIVNDVRMELQTLVRNALAHGVRRWNLILDPGIGFAKNKQDNLLLLRRLPELVDHCAAGMLRQCASPEDHDTTQLHEGPCVSLAHVPVLLGVSRKRFLGDLIHAPSSDPALRMQASIAACVATMATGCVDLIRVHDVAQAMDAVRTSDAIWRN